MGKRETAMGPLLAPAGYRIMAKPAAASTADMGSKARGTAMEIYKPRLASGGQADRFGGVGSGGGGGPAHRGRRTGALQPPSALAAAGSL